MSGDSKHRRQTPIDMASSDSTLCNDLPKLIAQSCRHLEAISDAERRQNCRNSFRSSAPGDTVSVTGCKCCRQRHCQKVNQAVGGKSLIGVDYEQNNLSISSFGFPPEIVLETDDLLLQIMQRALECSNEDDETHSTKTSTAVSNKTEVI